MINQLIKGILALFICEAVPFVSQYVVLTRNRGDFRSDLRAYFISVHLYVGPLKQRLIIDCYNAIVIRVDRKCGYKLPDFYIVGHNGLSVYDVDEVHDGTLVPLWQVNDGGKLSEQDQEDGCADD